MITPEAILGALYKGIVQFEKHCNATAERIQLVFILNADNQVEYQVWLDNEPWRTVKLKSVIGINVYNYLVEDYIKKLLLKLISEAKLPQNTIHLQAGVKAGNDVFLTLVKNKKEVIRIIEPDELTL